jgi:hypothetical protein
MSQPDIYTVFCIVVGEEVPFPVEIEKSKTVGQLKKLIKEERSDLFSGIPANFLNLYHVEIAGGGDMVEKVNQEMSKNPTALDPMKKLVNIFGGDPKEETLHIIVKPPRMGE